MDLIFFFSLGFLGLRWLITCLNLYQRPWILPHTPATYPKLSVLIPARDEAQNLPSLFRELKKMTYPELEILILDDHSTDSTWSQIQEAAESLPPLGGIQGAPLPRGWLGKNWACHQLAMAARGEYLIFLDADIHHLDPVLPQSAIFYLQRYQLALLSLFPDQDMHSRGEQGVVPLMHYLLLSLLPLWWIYRLPFPSMAAANGQFMAFNRQIYLDHSFHREVKGEVLDDIRIMQLVKKRGLKGLTLLGNRMIRCRMYKDYRDGIHGFGKNLLAGFGNQIWGMCLYLFLLGPGWLFAPKGFPLWGWGLILVGIFSIRGMISILARQDLLRNLLFHPLQMATLGLIAGVSIWKRITKQNTWKGRNVASA